MFIGRLAYLAALVVAAAVAPALVAGCGDDEPPAGRPTILSRATTLDFEPFWVGRSFAGLPLSDVTQSESGQSLIYGTCEPPSGEGGCATPLTIQVTSICRRNALLLDVRPLASRRVRGAVVRDYGDDRAELAIGDANVVIFAGPRLRERALAALRVIDRERRGGRLPRARYPRAYVLELRRVRDAYLRLRSVRAVRGELGISRRAVRFRLALARELGSRRLRRPAADFLAGGRPCAIERRATGRRGSHDDA